MTGFINVNKQQNISSAAEVGKIKRLVQTPCGHMGTLDPMAQGVLPVAIGNAARLFDYFLGKEKVYVATFCFGYVSDTLDTTGNCEKVSAKIPSENEIKEILPEFIGNIEQIPPKYSAKSINGKRGYQLARAGVDFELKPKTVRIDSVKCLGQSGESCYDFEIRCGGGTYIRSLARDIAQRLETSAVMSALTRTKSGPFTMDSAVRTCDLNAENIQSYLINTQDVLSFDEIHPSAGECRKLFNGLTVYCDGKDGIYKIFNADGAFYGIAEINGGVLKVKTKLC